MILLRKVLKGKSLTVTGPTYDCFPSSDKSNYNTTDLVSVSKTKIFERNLEIIKGLSTCHLV